MRHVDQADGRSATVDQADGRSATVDVELEIAAGARLEVVSCRVTEGMSLVTRAHVVLDAAEDLDLEDAVSSGATLTLTVGDVVRTFSLVVTRVRFTGIEANAHRFEAELHAPPWLLRYTSNTRKFRDMSAEDIVSKVLTEAGARFRWETTRKTRTRQYCAQYHESNLDFVTRLLEFEGIYFTLADDGTLVFADRSSASPSVGGGASPLEGAHFELEDAAGALGREAPGVHAFRRGAAAASGAATVSDFDWKNPKTSLRKTKVAALDSDLEVYDYPVGYRRPDEGALLAGLRLEALRVPASYVDGESSVAAFAPARLFSFGADAGDAFAGEYLLTRVEHHATRAEGGARAYENAFRAIPRAVPFRPPLVTPRPVVAGDHTAMVRGPAGEEIHTDEHGRFHAQFHWDREATSSDKDSRWIRWMQESATSMSLARVGWEVIVAYAAGDPDRPIGIGRHVNGQMIPTYGQPSNATMMSIKSPTYPGGATYNEWRMNDAAGAMTMDIHASRDLHTTVMNDRTEKVDNDVTHTNLASYSRAIGGNQAVVVGANSTTKVTGASAMVVNGSLATTIAGTEKVDVAASRTEAIQGDDTETVGSVRLTLDGSFHMPDLKALATSVASSALGAVGKQVGGVAGAAISGGAKGLSGGGAGVLASAEGAVKGEIGAEVGAAIGGALPAGAAGVVSGLVGSGASGSPKTELDGLLSGLAKSALPALPGGKAAGGGGGGGGPTPPAMGTSTGPGAASFLGPLGAAPAAFAAVSVDSPPAAPSPPSPTGAASALESGAASALSPSALLAACVSGNITRSAGDNMLRLVGGAYVAAALAPITVTAGKVDLETIGGAKLTMACEGDISEQVGTFLAVTVGGALLRKASGDITYASPTSSVNVTSIAKLASQKQVELLGTKISIEAKTSLTFTVGAVSIELTPAAIKLKGKVALTAKDTISTSGLPVDITAKA